MNCKNCGAELHEGSAFCGNCGMRIETEQPVYEAPAQPESYTEVHNEYQEQGYYQAPVQPEYAAEPVVSDAEKPNTVLWIVLNAIEIFTCCTVTGIVGLIFAILGHLSAEKGDFADAAKKTKTAKIWFWVGFCIGIAFVAFYAIIFALGLFTGFTEEMLYY